MKKWSGCNETKNKMSIANYALNVVISFDLGHDLDFEF